MNDAPEQTAYTTLTTTERVISEHVMHRMNCDSSMHLLPPEQFKKWAITLTQHDVVDRVVPTIVQETYNVIHKRTLAAKERARRQHEALGLTSPDQVDLAGEIACVLIDDWFVKGSKQNISLAQIRHQINDSLAAHEPIQFVANMFPWKDFSPLKTRGGAPDLSEVSILCRLAEIAGVVHELGCSRKRPDTQGIFNIVHDGTFFMEAHYCNKGTMNDYNNQTRWWTQQLGFDRLIDAHQYTDLLDNPSMRELKGLFIKTTKEARQNLSKTLDPLFNPKDMKTTIQRTIANDPYPDTTNPEGRFVPLFKSVMYSINVFCHIRDYAAQKGLCYQDLYRELTQNCFSPFADTSLENADLALAGGTERLVGLPSDEAKEILRINLVRLAWNATKEYMALTAGHRKLQDDLLMKLIGKNVIRCTVHPKPGQVGLILGDKSDKIPAWHGVAVARKSGSQIKISCRPRLQAEGEGGIPVLVESEGHNASDTPLAMMAKEEQPLCYVDAPAAQHFGIASRPCFLRAFNDKLTRGR